MARKMNSINNNFEFSKTVLTVARKCMFLLLGTAEIMQISGQWGRVSPL